jgi:hypothetical protein
LLAATALADLRDTPPVEIARVVAQAMTQAIPTFQVDGDAHGQKHRDSEIESQGRGPDS